MNVVKKYQDFRSTINLKLFSLYLAIVLIIPAITIIIEYYVSVYPAFRSGLQVDLQDFHVYQLFTSSFVHLNFDHFLGNVTAYLLIAIYGLVLATIVNRKRLYLVLIQGYRRHISYFRCIFCLLQCDNDLLCRPLGHRFGARRDAAPLLADVPGAEVREEYAQLLRRCAGLHPCHVRGDHRALHAPVPHGKDLPAPVRAGGRYRHPSAGRLPLPAPVFRPVPCHAGVLLAFPLLTVAIVLIFGYFVWNLFPERLANSTRTVSVSLHLAGIVIGILAGYLFMVYLEQMAYFKGEKEVISRP